MVPTWNELTQQLVASGKAEHSYYDQKRIMFPFHDVSFLALHQLSSANVNLTCNTQWK